MSIERDQEDAEMFRWFFENPAERILWLIDGCGHIDRGNVDEWKEEIRQLWRTRK